MQSGEAVSAEHDLLTPAQAKGMIVGSMVMLAFGVNELARGHFREAALLTLGGASGITAGVIELDN